MKKAILLLCCALICIAACKKNTTKPVIPVTQAHTAADTSSQGVDTSTTSFIWNYYGINHLISTMTGVRIDTTYVSTAYVTFKVKGTDTTVWINGTFMPWKKKIYEWGNYNRCAFYKDSLWTLNFQDASAAGSYSEFRGKRQ